MSVPITPAPANEAARVRAAHLSDLDALVALMRACFVTEHATRRALRYAIGSPTMSLLVAVFDDAGQAEGAETLVGAATLERRRNAEVARLSLIAVSPARVGRGLGRLLLQAVETEALDRGCRRLRLETRAENGAAIRLYERSGFARYAVKPGYYEDGAVAWCYEKPLDRL